MCFRFNSNGTEFTQSAGTNGGLSIELSTRLDEYYIGPNSNSPGYAVGDYDLAIVTVKRLVM